MIRPRVRPLVHHTLVQSGLTILTMKMTSTRVTHPDHVVYHVATIKTKHSVHVDEARATLNARRFQCEPT